MRPDKLPPPQSPPTWPTPTLPASREPAATIAARIRLAKLFDRGWNAVLGPTQLAVWITHNAYADAGGVSSLSAGRVAALMLGGDRGSNRGYVRHVQRRLCKLCLLEHVGVGGGSCNSRWLVLVPPERPAGGISATGVAHAE